MFTLSAVELKKKNFHNSISLEPIYTCKNSFMFRNRNMYILVYDIFLSYNISKHKIIQLSYAIISILYILK